MMKKYNLTFLSTVFGLTIFVSVNNSYAANPSTTSGIYFPTPITTSPPATTTTTGAAPSSTSGLMIPVPGTSAVSPGVNPGTISSPTATPVCVDSGVQGRRCGIEAVTFCKLNPQAENCQTLNNTKGDTNK